MADAAEKDGSGSAHDRAAETRRRRTRAVLLEAAKGMIAERGWLGTRVEDVARAAGTSTSTVYNHFPTKHALVAAVFAPVVIPCIERAQRHLTTQPDVWDAVSAHLHDLSNTLHGNVELTRPFLEAVWDALVRFGVADIGPNDPRALVPLPIGLIAVIEYGQEQAAIPRDRPAFDVSAYVANSLALQVFCFPHHAAESTAQLAIDTCRGILLDH